MDIESAEFKKIKENIDFLKDFEIQRHILTVSEETDEDAIKYDFVTYQLIKFFGPKNLMLMDTYYIRNFLKFGYYIKDVDLLPKDDEYNCLLIAKSVDYLDEYSLLKNIRESLYKKETNHIHYYIGKYFGISTLEIMYLDIIKDFIKFGFIVNKGGSEMTDKLKYSSRWITNDLLLRPDSSVTDSETDDLVFRSNSDGKIPNDTMNLDPKLKEKYLENANNEDDEETYYEEDTGEDDRDESKDNEADESEDYLINEITDLVDNLMFKLKDKIKQDKKYKKMLKNIKKFKGEL